MDAAFIYCIKVGGKVDESAFNFDSPLQTLIAPIKAGGALLVTRTDQAGLIGLLRYVHQQGYVLLSVTRWS